MSAGMRLWLVGDDGNVVIAGAEDDDLAARVGNQILEQEGERIAPAVGDRGSGGRVSRELPRGHRNLFGICGDDGCDIAHVRGPVRRSRLR